MLSFEVAVDAILSDDRERTIRLLVNVLNQRWAETGKDLLLSTSRVVRQDKADEAANLEIGRQISSALVAIVRGLDRPPAWFIAKGGITSSDMATEALGMRHATVLGALIPGVPVWRAVEAERWPDVPLVVFPGNVGTEDDLARAMTALHGAARG